MSDEYASNIVCDFKKGTPIRVLAKLYRIPEKDVLRCLPDSVASNYKKVNSIPIDDVPQISKQIGVREEEVSKLFSDESMRSRISTFYYWNLEPSAIAKKLGTTEDEIKTYVDLVRDTVIGMRTGCF